MVTACLINDSVYWLCTECGDAQRILQGGTEDNPWHFDEAKTLEATVGFKTLHALCRVEDGQILITYSNHLLTDQGGNLDRILCSTT